MSSFFKKSIVCVVLLGLISTGILFIKKPQLFSSYELGDAIDSLNHVKVFYNGNTGTVLGRNTAANGYNIGLKYQCVEFVKRYYFEFYKHEMPNSYGHAVSFFDKSLSDGEINKDRDLIQCENPSAFIPQIGDLIVLDATSINGYGHVAIISEVRKDEIQIIQQNPGATANSRVWYDLKLNNGKYLIDNSRVLGWLRMK